MFSVQTTQVSGILTREGEVSSGACGKSCIYLTIVHSRRLQAFKSREESNRPPCFFRVAVLLFYFLNCILLIKHAM